MKVLLSRSFRWRLACHTGSHLTMKLVLLLLSEFCFSFLYVILVVEEFGMITTWQNRSV